jgi:hypothetical protein
MSPFYVSVCVHAIFVLLILFVLPESLSSESRQILSKNAELAKAAAKRQDAIDREWESTPRHRGDPSERDPLLQNDSTFSRISGTDATHSRRRKRLMGNARRVTRSLFSFLKPLTVFAPRELEDGRKDWNLTKVGAGMFLIGCLYVSTTQVCKEETSAHQQGCFTFQGSVCNVHIRMDLCTGTSTFAVQLLISAWPVHVVVWLF